MPSPSSALSSLRTDLGGSFYEIDLEMSQAGFIGQQVLRPLPPVAKKSGPFSKIPVEELLKTRDTKRAPGGGYNRDNAVFDPSSYACYEHGLEEVVDDDEAQMYGDFFDAETLAAARARAAVLRAQEVRIAAAVYNTSVWTGSALTTAPTNEWDDATNAVPITDVHNARVAIYAASGLLANALVCNWKQLHNIKRTDQVVNLLKAQGFVDVRPGAISQQQLAILLDLDFVIAAGAPKNTALEGQSASISPIWSDEYVMVCRVAVTDDIREPCIGRLIYANEFSDDMPVIIETYRDESVRGEVVRCRHDVDELIIHPQAGHLLSNITT